MVKTSETHALKTGNNSPRTLYSLNRQNILFNYQLYYIVCTYILYVYGAFARETFCLHLKSLTFCSTAVLDLDFKINDANGQKMFFSFQKFRFSLTGQHKISFPVVLCFLANHSQCYLWGVKSPSRSFVFMGQGISFCFSFCLMNFIVSKCKSLLDMAAILE